MFRLVRGSPMKRVVDSYYTCMRNILDNRLQRYSTEGEEAESVWPERVVTGLQPTGALHVGNYFGALRRVVQLQDTHDDIMIFIADLHSLTTHQAGGGGESLEERSLALAAHVLAAGADPQRVVLFRQSHVPRHAELCWLLTCVAPLPRLFALPQYRARAAAERAGALLYPVLQAADVLLYRATLVPVGADQLQHLQLAAQLARSFAHRYGRAFPAPRPLLPPRGADRVRSLRDPARKMSKSDPDAKSRVLLTDADDVIERKIRKAVTDFTPQVTYDPEGRPGVSNLVVLHCLAAELEPEEAVAAAEGLTTAQYKRVVARELSAALGPVRARVEQLLARPRLLRDVLRAGGARARARADEVYEDVARRVGLH